MDGNGDAGMSGVLCVCVCVDVCVYKNGWTGPESARLLLTRVHICIPTHTTHTQM